jgi:hypothetical protein
MGFNEISFRNLFLHKTRSHFDLKEKRLILFTIISDYSKNDKKNIITHCREERQKGKSALWENPPTFNHNLLAQNTHLLDHRNGYATVTDLLMI